MVKESQQMFLCLEFLDSLRSINHVSVTNKQSQHDRKKMEEPSVNILFTSLLTYIDMYFHVSLVIFVCRNITETKLHIKDKPICTECLY